MVLTLHTPIETEKAHQESKLASLDLLYCFQMNWKMGGKKIYWREGELQWWTIVETHELGVATSKISWCRCEIQQIPFEAFLIEFMRLRGESLFPSSYNPPQGPRPAIPAKKCLYSQNSFIDLIDKSHTLTISFSPSSSHGISSSPGKEKNAKSPAESSFENSRKKLNCRLNVRKVLMFLAHISLPKWFHHFSLITWSLTMIITLSWILSLNYNSRK